MAGEQTGAVLRKRVSPARPVRRADESQLEQVLELEMPRSADRLLALEVGVQAVTQQVQAAEEVVQSLHENDLICLMTRDGAGAGLIVADAALIAAVIEIQTLGKVSASPVPERRATRVDVVILSDLIDRWLTDICEAAQALGAAPSIPFFGYARAPRDLTVRAVELMLEPVAYRSVRVSLALGGGAKTGALTLIVPAAGTAQAAGPVGGMGQRLEPHLMDAPVVLDAVLDRLHMSLTDVLALEPGRTLPIAREKLSRIRLEADGALLDRVRLGQMGGKRAVRMGSLPDDLPLALAARAPKSVAGEAAPSLPGPDPDGPDDTLPDLPAPEPDEMPLPEAEMATDNLPELPDLPELDGDLPDLPDLNDGEPLPDLADLSGLPKP